MTGDSYLSKGTHEETAEDNGERPPDPLARLASYVLADGRLRVPGLVVVDERGRELVEISARNREARVAVRLPSPPAHGRTEVGLYAVNGNLDDESIEPCLGIDIVVDGDQAAMAEVTPDRWGGWDLNVSTPVPDHR